MKVWLWLSLLVGAGTTSVAKGEDVEGLVRVAGRSFDTQTLITPETDLQGTRLCSSDLEQRIRHLTPLIVKVSGEWKLKKNGTKDCFASSAVKVLRMTSGRDAVVGTLAVKDGVYFVAGDNGVTTGISDVPPGLKKLVGQKVIVDAKPMGVPAAAPTDTVASKSDAASKQDAKVVVTYQAFP